MTVGIVTRRMQSAQGAAHFLVAGELARRGYEVSFTMGNKRLSLI